MPDDVTVTQADIDRAVEYWRGWSPNVPMVDGEYHPLVLLLARHRANHAPQAEPVAWMYTKPGATHVTPTRWKDIVDGKWVDGSPDWTETPLYTHPPTEDVAALVEHWRFLDKLIEDRIVETDQPDRVMWHGVWYDGPLATAYLETLRAIQKLARTALAKFGDTA